MTLIAVPITIDSPQNIPDGLNAAVDARDLGANLVEWRIDRLALTGTPEDVVRLVRDSPLPCIVTCRSASEGGGFDGHDELRRDIIRALAASDDPPRYIDVELSTIANDPEWRPLLREIIATPTPAQDRPIGIIISSHDFEGRPTDLLQRVETIAGDELTSVMKLAWRARSLRDNLEAFELLDHRQKPTIALCMGDFGLMSRVLAPQHEGLITFASLQGGLESAPGQPSISELRDVYRMHRIRPTTRVYGVIGWPVAHSRGPLIHNAGFEAVDHDGVYLPLPIPTEYEHFKATVGAMIADPRLRFMGASVTLPHKANLVRFVEEQGGAVGATAVRLGAANTLVIDDHNEVSCFNSDAPAVVAALERELNVSVDELAGRHALVLGAGGVARAVVAGLHDAGVAIDIVNRTPEHAEQMLADLDLAGTARVPEVAETRYDIIVNATSVGMIGGPDPDGSPLPSGVMLNDTCVVFDSVYTPSVTPLLRHAREQGAVTIGGVEMFLLQAAMQFESWTQQPAPLDVFRSSLNDALH